MTEEQFEERIRRIQSGVYWHSQWAAVVFEVPCGGSTIFWMQDSLGM